jgi:TatD DNase family protein
MLIDTHAHIHFDDFKDDLADVLSRARKAGVKKLLAVGVNDTDSERAVALAEEHDYIWASVGLHPHDADRGDRALEKIKELAKNPKVVAIGECGLDQYKSDTTHAQQEYAIRYQIELGLELKRPMIFHVREAFPDFWRIFDSYAGIKGVVHSFTATDTELQEALERGLYVALNGIMTFTKNSDQLFAAKRVPQDRLILETDCPFLAPMPVRGRRNEPANIVYTAEFLAGLRAEPKTELFDASTKNAETLFGI